MGGDSIGVFDTADRSQLIFKFRNRHVSSLLEDDGRGMRVLAVESKWLDGCKGCGVTLTTSNTPLFTSFCCGKLYHPVGKCGNCAILANSITTCRHRGCCELIGDGDCRLCAYHQGDYQNLLLCFLVLY